MPTTLSEVSTYTSTVSVPANGDARTVGSVNAAFQALANRTKRFRDWMLLLDANQDGVVDARLKPVAGTTAANTAPIKLTSGTSMTKAEAGAIEYDGTNLYFTPSATRKTVSFSDHTHGVIDGLLRPPAGTATADTAPVKFTTGTLNTKEETGALEFASKKLYFTPDASRLEVSFSDHTHAVLHAQNTDTGTTAEQFDVGSGNTTGKSTVISSSVTTTICSTWCDLALILLSSYSTMTISAIVSGRDTVNHYCGGFKIEGAVKRGNGPETVAAIDTAVAITGFGADGIECGNTMSVQAYDDTISGGLAIQVKSVTDDPTDWTMFGNLVTLSPG